MQKEMPAPRVLIADDDPISLRFLQAALAQYGCVVVAVANGAAALAAVGSDQFDVLLLDRRMPDLGGVDLLAALRKRGVTAPAIATSAEINPDIAAQLRTAGFAEILAKPANLTTLEQTLARFVHLPTSSAGGTATASTGVLDDASALSAIGGNAQSLRALRQLLAEELAVLERDLSTGNLTTRSQQLGERLHRLRASCGFCGATRLAVAARHLERTLRTDPALTGSALDDLLQTCRQTRAALDSSGVGIA